MRCVATIILCLLLPPPAAAQDCGCPTSLTPCAGYWGAAVVFAGRVDAVKRRAGGELASFTVLESFRGLASSAVEVVTGPPGHRCAVRFRVGREYMVYANRDRTGVVTASVCSRTRELDDAAADATYARGIKEETAAVGRIGGQVRLTRIDLTGRFVRPPVPLPGITVRVVKDGHQRSVVSDAGGDYSVANEGPGEYVIAAVVPERYIAVENLRRVSVGDVKSCAQADLTVTDNGRVSGRLLNAAGQAVEALTIELSTSSLRQSRRTLTDREGRFEIPGLPPGRFVLRAGVGKLATLAPVRLDAGAHAALGDVRLPASVNYVTVSGFVLRPDGTPAEGARVYLKSSAAPGHLLSEAATADFLGKFAIAGAEGAEYHVFAELPHDQHTESSDPIPITAAPGQRPPRLIVRRRY